MLVTELLHENALRFGAETALVSLESEGLHPRDTTSYAAHRRALTWGQWETLSNQIAHFYRSIGIGRGSRVGILLRNCLEWLPIWFGILKSGAVAVPLNFRFGVEDLVWCANHTELDALVLGPKCVEPVERGLEQLLRLRSFVYVGGTEDCPSFARPMMEAWNGWPTEPPEADISAEDDAAIYFSSGTTGSPKAVVYTHATLCAACALEQSNHGQNHNDVFLCIPPLYHVGAKFHWMANLLVGAKGVLLLGFSVPAFFEVMEREAVTIAFLLLPWAQDILVAQDQGMPDLGAYTLNAWRLLHMGAQPIPPQVLDRLRARFPEVACAVSYGLTEAGGPGCLNLRPECLDRRGSVGVPGAGWGARIVDDAGLDLPSYGTGELLVRGPHMMRCYWKEPESTAAALAGGWLHTGDLAYRDEDGFYYLVGRRKELIISGGEKIYPDRVENLLRTCPAVKDAAVFGLYHCRLGEAPVALVELKPEAECTEETLLSLCASLPRFQRPLQIFFGLVPRNPTGKIERVHLARRFAGQKLGPFRPVRGGVEGAS